MGTSNLIGDQIDTAKGRLSNISQDALSMLGQQNSNLSRQYDIANQDYQQQRQVEEADKARRAAAAQQAAMMSSQYGGGQGYSSQGQNTPPVDIQIQEPDFWNNLGVLAKKGLDNPVTKYISPALDLVLPGSSLVSGGYNTIKNTFKNPFNW
jgi:hypothetical protein